MEIEDAEKLIYEMILDGEDKENFTPEFQAQVIRVIKLIRG